MPNRTSSTLSKFASKAWLTLAAAVATIAPRGAAAQPPAPVDVVVKDEPPPERVASIEFNPAALLIDRISFNIEIVPVDHHALILSPYYFYPSTSAFSRTDSNGNTTLVGETEFEGFGGELGYRYYWGHNGPRGMFIGPSLIAAWVQAKAPDGMKTTFSDLGVAADIGYQMLVADDWLVSLGAGVQYLTTTKSIPDQQAPANFYANRGVQPRILFALGYAF